MSCCQNNTGTTSPTMRNIEGFNYPQRFNPANFNKESNTYTVGDKYYAAPWPAQRTEFDSNLKTKFNTSSMPDFLNYSNAVVAPVSETRKTILKGRYDSYSY